MQLGAHLLRNGLFVAPMAGVTDRPFRTLCRGFGHREGDFPNAERIARETVTLPLFPAMSTGDVNRVCQALAEILAGARR